MSLAELRAQAEIEENQEVTEEQAELDIDEPEQPETEAEEAEESEEAEEVDDFDFELDGEPDPEPKKPNATEALTYKLTKERKKRQKAQAEAEAKDSELDALRAELDSLKQAMTKPQSQPQVADINIEAPMPPDKWSAEINGDDRKYAQAFAEYNQKLMQWVEAKQAPQVQAKQQQSQYREVITKKAEALSADAAEFIQTHKIKQEVVIDAIDLARDEIDETTGQDGTFVMLMESLGKGGSKVGYHLGRNQTALEKVKSLLKNDPTGLKANSYLNDLKHQLKPKGRTISNAPEPDQPVKGDRGSVTAANLKKRYNTTEDITELQKIRKQARELGISLDD